MRYLPQRLDVLDDALSVVDNVRVQAPAAPVNAIRSGLARFLFRGAKADRKAGALSGASGSAPSWRRCCWPSPRRGCC
ncbi:hypothetical protein ACFQHO_41570 [Actinomadura yumaensis]|uniref:hypothetical protein n=1 Tax=Actinomadura sp. J1-007 TaxID=2661913 RepID=UPI0035CD124F